MKRFTTVLLYFAVILVLALLASDANAYQRYNGGCQTCHGAFTGNTSPKGTVFPSGSKHEMHRASSAMATDCDLCHRSDDSRNPFLNSSNGTANNTGSGCTGCHNGAGLRAHHAGNGVSVCAGCHGTGTPPAENVKPAYYGTVDTKANNSCNPVAQANLNENWTVGDFIGLDNDGDNLYDTSDPNCQTVPAGAMSVSPSGGLSSSGTQGGPFNPVNQTYTLTNTGGASINWSAAKTQTWVTLSSASGALAAGATATVTVSINSGANSLTAGAYSDTVTFTNTTNGTGDTARPVSLTVTTTPDTAPPIVSPPTSPDNNATGVAVGTNVTATFNESIDPASVNATSIILNDGVDNVVGTFSVNGAIVTFTPSVALSDNTTYTATLTTAVMDLAGNHLAANYSWTFTTSAASPAPTLPLETSGGGGCAMAGTKGDIKELAGAYGFLILTALGMAIRGRVKRKEK